MAENFYLILNAQAMLHTDNPEQIQGSITLLDGPNSAPEEDQWSPKTRMKEKGEKKSQLCLEGSLWKSPAPLVTPGRVLQAAASASPVSYLLDVRNYLWSAWWKDTVRLSPPPPARRSHPQFHQSQPGPAQGSIPRKNWIELYPGSEEGGVFGRIKA